jgi:hypothetical protein
MDHRPTDAEERADERGVPLSDTEATTPDSFEGPRLIKISDELKEEWHGLVQGENDRAVELVKKVWDDLAAADSSFFSLFKSTVVESIIERVTCNVIDYRSRRSTAGNGANLLITGVRGVGKTTLMRGLWRVLSSLQGDKLVAIYHDYETGRPVKPAELIFELFHTTGRQLPEGVRRTDDFKTLLQKLWQAGFRVAMFLDEIQTLFVPRDHGDFQTYLGITKDILVLGKSEYDCFGVLSGSTSNVHDLAYHKDPIAQAGSYPNLNNTVYCEYHLSPIRDRQELRSIMLPGTSDEQVDACFRATGGVGRSLKRYVSDPTSYAMAGQDFQEELSRSEAFFVLVAKMANRGSDDNGSNKDDVWKLATFEYNAVKEMVLPRLEIPGEFNRVLLKWLDSGFFYKTPDNTYQVLVPSHLASFASYLKRSSDATSASGALKAAVLGTISRIGWDGEGSAGHLIERYLCKRLCEADGAHAFWDPLSEEVPCEYLGQVRLADAIADTTTIIGPLFSLSQDFGIDGVFLSSDPDIKDAFRLHTLQVKCGRLNKRVTLGGRAAENPSKPNDQVMKGIVFKARCGIEAILRDLEDTIRITGITYTLVTTKEVTREAKEYLVRGFEVAEWRVKCYLHDQDQTLALFEPSLQRLIGE